MRQMRHGFESEESVKKMVARISVRGYQKREKIPSVIAQNGRNTEGAFEIKNIKQ